MRSYMRLAAVILAAATTHAQWLRPPVQSWQIPRESDAYLRMQFFVNGYRMLREGEARQPTEEEKKLVDTGSISALDLKAPVGAVRDFNSAVTLLKQGKSPDAVERLKKAVKQYPSFVSAHNLLGFAYEDINDAPSARAEFESATKLDPKFVDAFVALGRMDLADQDVAAARSRFESAAALRPADPAVLTMLCYSQHGSGQYQLAIDSAARVHALDHKGLPNVHYIAAASAIELKDAATAKQQYALFVQEDPANPLAPQARQNIAILDEPTRAPESTPQTSSADSERLRQQLAALDEPGARTPTGSDAPTPAADADTAPSSGFTFRSTAEEVALFFVVTNYGRTVTDLEASEVSVLDAGRRPDRILQFTPQSKLPLRLALLIDTSGSVRDRFAFEKQAAAEFVQKMLSNPSDMAFVAGFSSAPKVTQDFTATYPDLAMGIEKLENGGGTALFDAVSFACWKLAAYPERERVANVLVILSDGEDTSSHSSLNQAIRDAESTGVTIYTISTSQRGPRTAADKILIALAERSGGESMFPAGMMGLGHSFDKLHDIIRSRYLLAYKPANFVPNGAYRTINVTAQRGTHRFNVHARKGYYARRASGVKAAPPQ